VSTTMLARLLGRTTKMKCGNGV